MEEKLCKRGHVRTNLNHRTCYECRKIYNELRRKNPQYEPTVTVHKGKLPEPNGRLTRDFYGRIALLLRLNPNEIIKILFPKELCYQPGSGALNAMMNKHGLKCTYRWQTTRLGNLALYIRVIKKVW
jgi:hypothetical protein